MATTQQTETSADSRSLIRRYWWVVGIAIAIVVVFLAVPLASSDPDGLEKVAEDKEFIEQTKDSRYEWLPDYTVPGVDGNISGILAGIIGVAIVFALMAGYGYFVARRRTPA